MMQMLRLWRSRSLTFLDHFSNEKQFAILFDETDFDGESDSLPALWQFLMAVLVERAPKEGAAAAVGGSDDEWAMNKARCIRTLYRWAARLNQSPSPSASKANSKSPMLRWMRFADEQIMANTPLVVIETLRFSLKHSQRRALHQFMLKVLCDADAAELKHILKLMRTKHTVIQYNAMLLMSNVIDFDPQCARISNAMGATALLEAYKRSKTQ